MAPKDAESSEEEDYMSMALPTAPPTSLRETPMQRRMRLKREAEERARPKSKAELKIIEDAEREEALSRSLFDRQKEEDAPKSKGAAMMAKLGYKPGQALGKGNMEGRIEPVGISLKDDRGGIGLDAEKKRKFREEVEGEAKRVKAEEGEYRERVRREREEGKLEGQVAGAMRVAERLYGEREESVHEDVDGRRRTVGTKPLKQINVLWRGLVRKREEKERDRRMRYDLHQSLSRLPTYEDDTEDADDKRALGKDLLQHTLVEDLEEDDPELDEFNALEPRERLQKLVEFLRDEFNYCFWCKTAYPDKEMDGCPGITEEDHD